MGVCAKEQKVTYVPYLHTCKLVSTNHDRNSVQNAVFVFLKYLKIGNYSANCITEHIKERFNNYLSVNTS